MEFEQVLKKPLRFKPVSLGPLPADIIGEVLGVELADGPVHLSIPAQKHAYRRHGREFLACMPYLSQAIATPTYVGQAPHHKKSFEIIYSTPLGGMHILVAVQVRIDSKGRYQLSSVYQINKTKIATRLKKGFLKKIAPTT